MKFLEGLLVADFSRVLAGPLCTQLLADHGARVIKVEEPVRGDETRRWGPPFVGESGISAYFLSINRGKESLALDLKSPGGAAIARELVTRADVVVDNFLPSQKTSLQFPINPRAVHCSIRGYDDGTSEAGLPGYDLLAQAGAGLMSITGAVGGDPMKTGVALSDVLTAHYAFGAIAAALVERAKAGKGASLEISLFGATVASLVNVAQSALVTGNEAGRYGNAHPSIVPYQLFHGSDGAFALGAGTERHFQDLCVRVVQRPELARDERFSTNATRVGNREALVAILEELFRTESAAFWVERAREASIPASLVRGVREALDTEGGQALIGRVEHPDIGAYEAVRNPVRVNGVQLPIGSAPPTLGQHTAVILRELGYTQEDIVRLARSGAVGSVRDE